MAGRFRLRTGVGTPVGVLALIALGTAGLEAQTLSYEGSLTFARGSYVFTQPTNSFWLSNGLSFRSGRILLSATLPVIVQNSGIVSFVAGQPIGTGGEDSGVVARRNKGEPVGTHDGSGRGRDGGPADGLLAATVPRQAVEPEDSSTVYFRDAYEIQVGDPLVSGFLELHAGAGFLRSLTLGLSAKAPVRSVESGVGTGAWDVGGGLSAAAGAGRNLVLADVWYWSYGDLPDLELDPGWMWGASVSRTFSGGRIALSASVAGATAMTETMEAPLSVGVGLMSLPRIGRAFSAGLWFGLTEASPDLSASVGWSLGLLN